MAESHPRRRLDQPRSGRRFAMDIDPETFGRFSERLARFLGTGTFLFWQTLIVIAWITINLVAGRTDQGGHRVHRPRAGGPAGSHRRGRDPRLPARRTRTAPGGLGAAGAGRSGPG